MPVLIAEDNPTNIEVLTSMLELLEYEFLVAEDGERVVELALSRDDIQLVLMDVQMPKMDGYAATAEIRRCEREQGRARVPIVALTGYVRDEDRAAALESGMDGFLTKPINLDELEEMLETRCAPPARTSERPAGPDALLDDTVIATFREQNILDRAAASYALDLERGEEMLRRGLEQGDEEALARAAHFVKGSAATMGANRAASIAGRLEDATGDARRARAEELLEALEATSEAVAKLTDA